MRRPQQDPARSNRERQGPGKLNVEENPSSKLDYFFALLETVRLCAKIKYSQEPNSKIARLIRFISRPWVAFIIGTTVGYPVEHLLWTKIPPFAGIAKWIGLQ